MEGKIRILPRKTFQTNELLINKLKTADIATIGHYSEFGFMDKRIMCLNPNTGKVFGRAITVHIPAQESKALHIAVSMAMEGDVIVIDRCGDAAHAAVGEMIALCSNVRKVAAIVVDGPITDFDEIMEIGIPVFATGLSAMTTKFIADCGEINYDIVCGGIVVHPGDMIMADKNGVLVLRDFELEGLLDVAIQDQLTENGEKQQVLAGKTLQQLYVPDYPL